MEMRVRAEVSGRSLKADVRAGGRLSMRSEKRGAGGRRLLLQNPLVHPWKLYWVDPLGPKEEVKLGAVVTLDEPTWPAVESARRATRSFGEERYREWRGERGIDAAFDGSFAFLVLGDPGDRLTFDIAGDGRVVATSNRLTDRWLSGELDPLLKAWQAAPDHRRQPRGYWFWNEGEAEPFAFEPHTYRALEKALELLSQPWLRDAAALKSLARGVAPPSHVLTYDGVVEGARKVVEVLAPKTRGRLNGEGDVAVEVRASASEGGLRLTASARGREVGSGRDRATVEVRRDALYLPGEGFVADRLRITVRPRSGVLEVEVGYSSPGADSLSQ